MILLPPIENFDFIKSITQLFGVSYNYYNSRFGIPGHNALDIVQHDALNMSYGVPIRAAHAGVISKITIDNVTRSKGTGVTLLGDIINDRRIETISWHLADFRGQVGQRVNAWDIIGLMGNTGLVKPKPTKWAPYLGTHVHWGARFYDAAGNLLQNEYNGFVDPTPMLFREGNKLPIYFGRNLFIGNSGDDVSWLQTILKIEFPDLPFEPINYFGNQTRKAVARLQERYEIYPTLGFVGPKTRDFLMSKYT